MAKEELKVRYVMNHKCAFVNAFHLFMGVNVERVALSWYTMGRHFDTKAQAHAYIRNMRNCGQLK